MCQAQESVLVTDETLSFLRQLPWPTGLPFLLLWKLQSDSGTGRNLFCCAMMSLLGYVLPLKVACFHMELWLPSLVSKAGDGRDETAAELRVVFIKLLSWMSIEVCKVAIKNPWQEQWDNNPLYRLQFNLNHGRLNKSRSKTSFFKLHTDMLLWYFSFFFFFPPCHWETGFGLLFGCLE